MRPLRVVHVGCELDPSRRGGEALLEAWPTLPAVASAIARAGIEVAVVQAAHRDEIVRRDGVAYQFVAEPALARIPWTRGAAGRLPLRLARAAAARRPDVLHLHGLGFPLHVAALARTGPPLLVQDHGDAPRRRWRAVRRHALGAVAAAVFTAREQADPFFQAGLLRPGTPIIEAAESSTTFTPGNRAASRAATGVRGNPAVLWVGRLHPDKDPRTALEAFARASADLPEAHLWCCFSDAPLLPEVQARVDRDPALRARVHLLGHVPHRHVELLCRAADILLLTSLRESTGYALLEALACGCTPVASDIPAARALTGRGTVGLLAPPGDARAFGQALVRAAAESAARRDGIVAHFSANLSFAALGRRFAHAYETLAEVAA